VRVSAVERDLFDLGEVTAKRLDQWRTVLLQLPTSSTLGLGSGITTFLNRELRGAAIVAAMAEVENLVRTSLLAVSTEINTSSTQLKDLKQALRALAVHSSFMSLSNTRDTDKTWDQRHFVSTLDTNPEIASLPGATTVSAPPPLDGRTIRPSHILRIWAVLGLGGSPFPAPRCSTSLTKLALLRNDIAHRNIPISEVFQQPGTSATQIAQYLDDIQLLVLHVASEIASYCSLQSYKT